MTFNIFRRLLDPVIDIQKRRRFPSLYATHPLRLLRRTYLHLERTLIKSNKVLMLPVRVKLNTGYSCNLKCPLCATGRRDPRPSSGQLTLAGTRSLLPRLTSVEIVSLFGWGEPFLNREIFDIIDLLKLQGKFVSIDSHLSIKDTAVIERLAKCPIDLLTVSLDGADEASYATYRFGGSFELVIRNLRMLMASNQGPRRIRWQYIVSRKNQAFIERARELSKELGVEMFVFDIGMYNEMFYEASESVKREWWTDEQMARIAQAGEASRNDTCMYMYDDPYVDFDGNVYPCCHAPNAPKELTTSGFQNVFGSLRTHTLRQIWNNGYYQAARSLFSGRGHHAGAVKPICLRCRAYLKRLPGAAQADLLQFDPEPELLIQLPGLRQGTIEDVANSENTQ